MPFKPDTLALADTYVQDRRRFLKLEKSPDEILHWEKDIQIMFMNVSISNISRWYPKTKFLSRDRVVFDWSATSSSGVSINGSLVVGPTVQEDLFPILIHFWLHKVALSFDSVNVYRQIALESCAKDFHRILWRDSPGEPIKYYIEWRG